jgi:hypothetical protein
MSTSPWFKARKRWDAARDARIKVMDAKLVTTIVLVPIVPGLYLVVLWKLTAAEDPQRNWEDHEGDLLPKD